VFFVLQVVVVQRFDVLPPALSGTCVVVSGSSYIQLELKYCGS